MLDIQELPDTPKWLNDLIAEPKSYQPVSSSDLKITEGARNSTLTSIAGAMRKWGCTPDTIAKALHSENHKRCGPPLSDSEVDGIAKSVSKYAPSEILDSGLINILNLENPESQFFSLSDLFDVPDEDVQYVWQGVLRVGGLSNFSSKPKVGKTTTAENLALSVARGKPFLGRETKPGTVLYLALEEHVNELKNRFMRMGAKKDEKILFHVGMAPQEPLSELKKLIGCHNPVLVIIDPLFKYIPTDSINDYGKMTVLMMPLLNLARTTGTHIMCVHHMRKGSGNDGDSVLGSTAIFASVDANISMHKNGKHRIISSEQRYGTAIPDTVLRLDPITDLITAAGEYEGIKLKETSELILEVLGESSMTEPEIKEAVGHNHTVTAKALRRMVEDKRLEVKGKGVKHDPKFYRKCSISGLALKNNPEKKKKKLPS